VERLIHQTRTRNAGVNRMLDKFVPAAETRYIEDPDGVALPGEFQLRYVFRRDVARCPSALNLRITLSGDDPYLRCCCEHCGLRAAIRLGTMQSTGADERSLALLAHILSAERLWLERIKQQTQSSPVWPKTSLENCAAQVEEMGRLWREYLSGIAEKDLGQTIFYRNSKGELWTSSVSDILTHIILHSTYHRGQIASHIRASGKTPAYTDFIRAVRQGFLN
jgi:uncharacterized damage-inducible protein DinB